MPLAYGLGRRDDRANPTLYSAARVPHSVPSRAYARGTTPASPACTTRREPTSPTPATPCTRQALGATTDETTATGVAQAVHRCGLRPARSSATAANLARLPTSWCDTYAQMQRPLRAAQADLLAETYSKRDYIGVAATGSGKGAVWLVPAGAEARAALIGTEPRALGPVNLVVVPLSAPAPRAPAGRPGGACVERRQRHGRRTCAHRERSLIATHRAHCTQTFHDYINTFILLT